MKKIVNNKGTKIKLLFKVIKKVIKRVAGNLMVYKKVEELLKIKQVQALKTLLLLLIQFPTF